MIYYDLIQEASRGGISDCAGREKELAKMARTLERQFNNNVLIRGSNGIGKTALAEALAFRAATKLSPFAQPTLTNTARSTDQPIEPTDRSIINAAIIKPGNSYSSIVKLNNSDLYKYFSQLHLAEIKAYLSAAWQSLPNSSIVIIDDFDNAVPEQKFLEVSRCLQPFLSENFLRLVITVSENGYQNLYRQNPNFFQYFEEITLAENDLKESAEILRALRPAFEQQYAIAISDSVIEEIAKLSYKLNSDKKMPLKAMHFLDECLASAKIEKKQSLDSEQAAKIYAEKNGIPFASLGRNRSIFKDLSSQLKAEIIGQDQALEIISDAVIKSQIGLRNKNRPFGCFMFLGPSGVGKTETCKMLAKKFFDSERAFTRIDMSEFSEAHTVQRLIGAPPGYIGYENGGQLTNAIRQQPYSLILLDEIEKAHPKIFDIFLQVLEDGRLTDGQGRVVDFTNAIIIATSNLGVNQILDYYENKAQESSISASMTDGSSQPVLMPSDEKLQNLRRELMTVLQQYFRLEFLNRFDDFVIFNVLSIEDLVKIALLEIRRVEQRTAEHGVKFKIDPQVLKSKIVQLADNKFGARPIKKFVEQTCESLIALNLQS